MTAKTLALAQSSYLKLVSELKGILSEGQSRAEAAVEREKAITYWRLGQGIQQHLLENKDRADYGKRLFFRLSSDLKIGERILYQTVQFYNIFPNLHARANLEWSHYRVLMSVGNKEKRNTFAKQAAKLNWSTRELEEAVKYDQLPEEGAGSIISEGEIISDSGLIPVKGQLYTYRVLAPDYVYSDPGKVVIDLGFYICSEEPRSGIAEAKGGEIIESIKKEEGYEFKYSNLQANQLYTYKAIIDKIIDGDTFWVKVDCGLNTWIRQKLRLRGIDTPELSMPKGQKAKLFVEKALGDVPFIVIKTYKTDKYDRYLADIFYLKSTVPKKILEKGTFLNQQLLDLGLAKPM